tara:strand:- start:296 stop:1402 length:1107 start_codon:yes stop_codon:yes gene_type:complete
MGGKSVTYKAPPTDDTFSKYLAYQQNVEKDLDARAQQEKAEAAAEKAARTATGASGYAGFRDTIQQQLYGNQIDLGSGISQIRDYATKYNLDPPEKDIADITGVYNAALPGKRATGMSAAYEELLGRQATPEELSKGQERFQQGYYGSIEDFKGSLAKSPEYQEKFNQSYLDNYYDTMFGKQTVDEKGGKTGKRTFTFDGKTLTGSVAEIEEQQSNIKESRQYLYASGLTKLQGEIDKESLALKNEGAVRMAEIASQAGIRQTEITSQAGIKQTEIGSAANIRSSELAREAAIRAAEIASGASIRSSEIASGATLGAARIASEGGIRQAEIGSEGSQKVAKIGSEGSQKVAKIGAAGNLYSNLVSGFW